MFKFLNILALFSAPAFAFEMPATDYAYVAASQTNQKLGPVGGAGDVLAQLIIIPDTTTPGTVILSDGLGLSQKVFVSTTVSDLRPIVLTIGARSVSGSWTVTTGANEHILAVGRFK